MRIFSRYSLKNDSFDPILLIIFLTKTYNIIPLKIRNYFDTKQYLKKVLPLDKSRIKKVDLLQRRE